MRGWERSRSLDAGKLVERVSILRRAIRDFVRHLVSKSPWVSLIMLTGE
jgi:hypothetical protein